MMGRTHMLFGFLIGIIFYRFFNANPYIFIFITTLSSLLPDVDHENSKINNKIPILKIIPRLFQHRGFFHSIFLPTTIFIAAYIFNFKTIGIPIAIGYLSHLLADSATKAGCNLLHPISRLSIRGPIETGSIYETIILFGIIAANVYFTYTTLF